MSCLWHEWWLFDINFCKVARMFFHLSGAERVQQLASSRACAVAERFLILG